MKLKATKREIKNSYSNLISVGYCDLQHLLYFKNPFAYSAGVYGWSCDYYEISNNTCICTGYIPVGNIDPEYQLILEYNNLAQNVIYSNLTMEQKREQVNTLLNEFIQKALNK